MSQSVKAIVLLSGGLDSAVTLAMALEKKRTCIAISFDYNQRHRIELKAAQAIAAHYGILHHIIKIDTEAFNSSPLVKKNDHPNSQQNIAKDRSLQEIRGSIPSTYVPARNTIFLAYATAYAEMHEAQEIYLGANLDDVNGYPDCRPAFIKAFQEVLNVATSQSLQKKGPKLMTPLIEMDKIEIVKEGRRLGLPVEITWSCYDPVTIEGQEAPCQRCDACILRLDAIR